MTTRTEHDLLGAREVPADALYGIHALRSSEAFRLVGAGVHPALVRALAEVKQACAVANARTGHLDERIADAIVAACEAVARGEHQDQFITDALQGGAGTSMNMNVNEVIANLANLRLGGKPGQYDLVHPLDHVNLSQSTNDVVPTALHLATIRLVRRAAEAMAGLQRRLQQQEAAFAGLIKLGRTEMQDAVPMTLGQEFSAWAQAVQRDWWRLYKAEERLRQVNLGGTAIGTGLNAERRYGFLAVEVLRDITGLGVARAENLIDATQNIDVFVEVSGLLKAAATSLAKIAGDLRLLSSGPRGGFGELHLPEIQAGSSIMPGKVNPVIPEAVTQVAYQVMANDLAITLAAAHGQLELNAFMPLVAHNLLQSCDVLAAAATLLGERCIAGITADAERCRQTVERSTSLVTALSPYIGYEAASDIARTALETGRTIRDLARERGHFAEDELERILETSEMTRPGIAGHGEGAR